jgi:hypothetical protein
MNEALSCSFSQLRTPIVVGWQNYFTLASAQPITDFSGRFSSKKQMRRYVFKPLTPLGLQRRVSLSTQADNSNKVIAVPKQNPKFII